MRKYAGGRKIRADEKQAEARSGRKENVAKKAAFKSGPQARVDPNAGRVTPLIPAKFVAVPPKKKAAKGPATL